MRQCRQIAITTVLFWVAACGANFTDKAHKTLATSLIATNAARDGFVEWDHMHQLKIVEAAQTRMEAETALATYRAKRKMVLQSFLGAYTTIAAALAILPLIERGTKGDGELTPLLLDAVRAVIAVKAALKEIQED